MIPKVMIILGSGSDIDIAKKSINILEKLEIPYSLKIASAHRTHDLVKELVIQGTNAGIEVFIGIAGLAAHLPGVIAAYTSRPVIGVPVSVKLDGLDALYASVQMPYPSPVATVGIDRGDNAAILAAQIIGLNNETVAKKVSELRLDYKNKVINSNNEIIPALEGKYMNNDFLSIKSLDIRETEPVPECDKKVDVSIIANSFSDMIIAKKVGAVLDRLKISHSLEAICPVRASEKFEKYVKSLKSTKVFIGISSNSAQVTGGLVGLTEKPVIGVPCVDNLGVDALLSMVNMPPGVPVATLGLNNGRNAAILAAEILSISDPNLKDLLEKTRNKKINL